MKYLLSRKWTPALGVGVSLLLLVGAFFLTGALPGVSRQAHAAAGDGGGCDFTAKHSQCTFKGIGADAGFVRENGCLLTGVDVSILQDVSHSSTDPDAETTQIFVEFDQNDACSFVQVAQAEGQAVGVEVQGDQQLTTASVTATMPLTGFGVPDGFMLTISVTWHGIGETTTGTDTLKFRSPDGHSITRTVTTVRSAIATGTVSDGTTNYASMPSTFTELFYDQAGQVVINHP